MDQQPIFQAYFLGNIPTKYGQTYGTVPPLNGFLWIMIGILWVIMDLLKEPLKN